MLLVTVLFTNTTLDALPIHAAVFIVTNSLFDIVMFFGEELAHTTFDVRFIKVYLL